MSEKERCDRLERAVAELDAVVKAQAAVIVTFGHAMKETTAALVDVCEHIGALEGAMNKLIRIVDPDGADRAGIRQETAGRA